MEELLLQLAVVERFTKPPVVQPILGARIYLPEGGDRSLQAVLKRKIIEHAEIEIDRAHAVLSQRKVGNKSFQSEMLSQIETDLADDQEFREFIQYATAIVRLAELTDAATK